MMKFHSIGLCFLFAFTGQSNAFDMEGNYSVRGAAEYAAALVDQGSEEGIARASQILEKVLSFQETRDGATHRGNFLWESESKTIQDLNSVEFTLTHLIPLVIENRHRLPEDLVERLLASIRLGLEEIRNLDVALTYTNIASMDCCNSCLGGELLGDEEIAKRGYRRLREFAQLIIDNGTVFEFNSPNYMPVTVRALQLLEGHVRDPETRLLAKLMADRLGLSIALRIHPRTGTLAGPYSRAYYRTLIGDSTPYPKILQNWVEDEAVSPWVGKVKNERSQTLEIRETAVADWKIGTTTFLSPSYSLGVASREVSRQTNPMVIQVDRPGETLSGLICSRYFLDDPSESQSETPEDEANLLHFVDHGKFFGVQEGPRAIGVFAPRGVETPDSFAPASLHRSSSAKAALVWLDASNVGEIWAGGKKVEGLPYDLVDFQAVVVETGPVWIAIKPLAREELGHASPIRLVRRGKRLLFEMYNYLGPEKIFWDLDRGSRFYKGQPYCACYVEVADRSVFPSGPDFLLEIERSEFSQRVDPPMTSYRDQAVRHARFEATRDGKPLGLEIDLMEWELTHRWTSSGVDDWPMLESLVARQNSTGRIEAASATLACASQPALLFGDPDQDRWVVHYYGDPGPLSLVVPGGSVTLDQMSLGQIVWEQGDVSIESLNSLATPRIQGAKSLNGNPLLPHPPTN